MIWTDEEFAQIYNAAPSLKAASVALNLSYGQMLTEAWRIRKTGVELKRHRWAKIKRVGVVGWLKQNHPQVWEEWYKYLEESKAK